MHIRKTSTDKNSNFIEKATKIHSDLFLYDRVDYTSAHKHVSIGCRKHGYFEQTPTSHLAGSGCKRCSLDKLFERKRLTTEEFIDKACSIHGSKYDYSKVVYVNSQDKVVIICHEHGDFFQQANSHLSSHGCPKCAAKSTSDRLSLTLDKFILRSEEVHNAFYDYSQVNVVCAKTKVDIICPIHGKFTQEPRHHMDGHGCVKCASEVAALLYRKSNAAYIEDAISVHGTKYDYSLVDYKGAENKVSIKCPEHGVFHQSAQSHLSGRSCPKCGRQGGFNQMLPAIFYILRSGSLTKIGVTNKTALYRALHVSQSSKQDFEVVAEYESNNGFLVLNAETKILRDLRTMYKSPLNKFDGSTECFFDVDYSILLELIEKELGIPINEKRKERTALTVRPLQFEAEACTE